MADATPTETVVSPNAQDFRDGDIIDGFGEGPIDTPLGVGGEHGQQSQPASTTLEADIANGPPADTKTLPGDDSPSDDSVSGEPDPVQDTADEGGVEPQATEPEIPDFPQALLQMAGYATPEAAQQAGFQDSASLFAAVQWRGKLLTPEAAAKPAEGSLYRKAPVAAPQQQIQPEPQPQGDTKGFKPFQPTNADMLDEELLDVIQQQNEHFASLFQQQQEQLNARDEMLSTQQALEEELRFDEAVQGLGKEWKDVFGEGKGHDLGRAGDRDPAAMTAFNHRAMMFSAVEAVREANAKQGFQPMSLEQEVQWALMQRYPDKFQQQLRQAAPSNGRRGVQASRPTARKTPLADKNERLLSKLQGKYPGVDFTPESEADGF